SAGSSSSALSTASWRYGEEPSVGTTTVTSLAADGIVVELEHAAGHRLLAEPLLDAAPARFAQPPGLVRVVAKPSERRGQLVHVAHEDPGHAVDDELGRAADRGRDD